MISVTPPGDSLREPMPLSIIIPTLNEAENLPGVLSRVRQAASGEAVELIVSDCGSVDGTAAIATTHGAGVLTAACCRACAMNRGARRSAGDVLLFLHADTLLPDR